MPSFHDRQCLTLILCWSVLHLNKHFGLLSLGILIIQLNHTKYFFSILSITVFWAVNPSFISSLMIPSNLHIPADLLISFSSLFNSRCHKSKLAPITSYWSNQYFVRLFLTVICQSHNKEFIQPMILLLFCILNLICFVLIFCSAKFCHIKLNEKYLCSRCIVCTSDFHKHFNYI